MYEDRIDLEKGVFKQQDKCRECLEQAAINAPCWKLQIKLVHIEHLITYKQVISTWMVTCLEGIGSTDPMIRAAAHISRHSCTSGCDTPSTER